MDSTEAITLQGIQALEREYQRQKKAVEKAQTRLDELRRELRITDSDESSHGTKEAQTLADLQSRKIQIEENQSQDSALLLNLEAMSRRDLRKALPTALQPPDEHLNRYLADLGKAEQRLASLSSDYSLEHPESRRVTQLMARIEQQIERRIDGILAGLEIRVTVAEQHADELRAKIEEAEHAAVSKQQQLAAYFSAKRNLEASQRILDTIYMRILAEKVNFQIQEKAASATPRNAEETPE